MLCDRQHEAGGAAQLQKRSQIWDVHQHGDGYQQTVDQVFDHFGLSVDAILAKEAELEAREAARAAKKT